MPNAIGIPEEMLRQAAGMAVCKINIDSDIRVAMTAAIRKHMLENPSHFDPRQYLTPARAAVKSMVAHKSATSSAPPQSVIELSFQKAEGVLCLLPFLHFFGKEAHSMPFDYDAPIYYPPYENRSILIPASYGCPTTSAPSAACTRIPHTGRSLCWTSSSPSGRCRKYRPYSERVFLLGGQSFCLKADKLKEILRYIRERLPLCEAVSMYASIRSVADKTDADLAELKALGLGKLYIGVESGCDEILEEMHKGHTGEEAAAS